jgi:LAS superfamily LD-carboxypeptidase LdcB
LGFFTGHRLIQEVDGYVLVLYVDLKTELSAPLDDLKEEKNFSLRKQVEEYIATNFPNLRIKLAHIVSGAILVATFSLFPAEAVNNPEVELSVPSLDTIQITPEGSSIIKNNPANAPSQSFRMGDRGKEIRLIQERLAALGFNIRIDGVYNQETSMIITKFMEKYPERKLDTINGAQLRPYFEKILETPYRIISDLDPENMLVLVNKSYSLPHDYVPNDLVVSKVPFTFAGDSPKKMLRKEAAQALEELFKQAEKEQVGLLAVSGYRSYDQQAEIFARNYGRSGSNANQFSARPGESEHQTGLAMDVTCAAVDNQLTQKFGDTREGGWLLNNASEFGFIIRFPKGSENITGYQYEPWHIRYVGIEAAKKIMENNETLEEYLR